MKSDTWSAASLAGMHDAETRLRLTDDELILKTTQELPDHFFDEIAAIRDVQDNNALGNFALAARIPTAVVEHWMRQGFNIFDKDITVADIVKRLRSLDMDKLIATEHKRLY